MVRDYASAYQYGVRTEDVLVNLAFGWYEQWLQNGSGSLSPQAQQLILDALQLDPENAVVWFDLSFYQLLAGDTAADSALQQVYLSAALSALDNLQSSNASAFHPGLAATLDRYRGMLTATIGGGTVAGPSDDPAVRQMSADARGAVIGTDATNVAMEFPPPQGWGGAQGERSLTSLPVVVAWYHQDQSDRSVWTALPETITLGPGASSPLQFLAQQKVYLTAAFDANCLPPGAFRAEIYVAGRRILTVLTTTSSGADLVRWPAYQPGAGVCAPSSWRITQSPAGVQGATEVLQSPDRSEAAIMLRVYAAKPPGAAGSAELDGLAQVLTGIVDHPSAWSLPLRAGLARADARIDGTFAGQENSVQLSFAPPGGGDTHVIAGIGLADDGAYVVGIVAGPAGDTDARRALLALVFSSFALTG